MNMKPPKSAFEQRIASEFPLQLRVAPNNDWLRARREAAFALFEQQGLPSRRDEDWHYTDLRNMIDPPVLQVLDPMVPSTSASADAVGRLVADHARLSRGAIADGPTPDGVEIYSLATALRDRPDLVERIGEAVSDDASSMVALNTAFFTDMTFIVVRAGVKLEKPLHSNFIYARGMPLRIDTRALIILEDGAEATVINSVAGDKDSNAHVNVVIEYLIGNDAKLNFVRSVTGAENIHVIHTTGMRVGARSEVNLFGMVAGTKLSRTEYRIAMTGEHSTFALRGVNLLRGEQHGDVTLMVDHQAPHCESRELFRHIVDGEATGVFQGKIMVKKDAQKTDGQMASNAILLTDDCVMNNKPELEIFADDVVCAHGATCGALDDDLLFYLQARGLPKAEAEALMIQAFCGEAIEFVENDKVRDALNQTVAGWLAARSAA